MSCAVTYSPKALDRLANNTRTWGMQSYEYHAYHSHPAMQEYHALSAQIERGDPMHP